MELHLDMNGVLGMYWSDNMYEMSDKAKDAELGKRLWLYCQAWLSPE